MLSVYKVYMPRDLSTIYKNFYKKVVDSTTENIGFIHIEITIYLFVASMAFKVEKGNMSGIT